MRQECEARNLKSLFSLTYGDIGFLDVCVFCQGFFYELLELAVGEYLPPWSISKIGSVGGECLAGIKCVAKEFGGDVETVGALIVGEKPFGTRT